MNKIISRCSIYGNISAPTSKSMMIRALIISLLNKETTEITYNSLCNDVVSTIETIEKLGAKITKIEKCLKITGGFSEGILKIDCKESLLAVRLFSIIASLHDEKTTITGDDKLLNRTVYLPEESLESLGVKIETNNNKIPIKIKGPIKSGKIEIDGSTTSQILTGLLMTLPLAESDSEIKVNNLKSLPYIDMTICLLNEFGIRILNQNYTLFKIPGKQTYKHTKYTVEGDWSSAAFLLVAGAIGGKVTVKNLDVFTRQADKMIIDALHRANAKLSINSDMISAEKNNLEAFQFDANSCPDIFPPLVALAAHCNGTSLIRGVNRLFAKDSNRVQRLKDVFTKLGIEINIDDDIMLITGGPIKSTTIDCFNDHRIAMAVAVAAIDSEGEVTIENAECVAKSYVEFWDDLDSLIKK